MENKDNRNLEEEMDTASEAKAGEETAEAPRTEETADADTDSSEGNGEGGEAGASEDTQEDSEQAEDNSSVEKEGFFKKKKKDKKRKKNDSEILQLINKIDKKLEKGYTFANISRNHYEKIYKEEILNLYKTSKLKGDAEDSIKEVLKSLLGDLRKPGESFANKLETKASIDTLDTMLTMDGIKESELQIVARESLTKPISKRTLDMLSSE